MIKTNFNPGVDFGKNNITNSDTYHLYFKKYSEIALNMFALENLPDDLFDAAIFRYLFFSGQCLLFNVDSPQFSGYLASKCAAVKLDYYMRPVEFTPILENGYLYPGIIQPRTYENAVLLRANPQRIGAAWIVHEYCQRIAEIQTTIDVNAISQKTPVLIVAGDKREELSIKNAYRDFKGNNPLIIVDKTIMPEKPISVIKTDSPYLIDKLYTYKQQIENELKEFIGVKHNELFDKRERTNMGEVVSNNEMTVRSSEIMFKTLTQDIDRFNLMYDLNIKLSYSYSPERGEYLEI